MSTSSSRLCAKVFIAVALVGLLFAAYTEHAWEDYWITFRASRNLATGHGLVFTPGERVHSFTSPLGALLPAGFSWLVGNQNDQLVLWLFRIVSVAALAGGVVLLLRAMSQCLQHRLALLLTLAMIGLDAKTVDFSINGQETGLLVFFLGVILHAMFVAGPRQWLRLGLGWAGLMWSRPDSFVYIAALSLSAWIFLPKSAAETRTEWWRKLFKAGLICTVLYLPWFAWAWWYYGSPVPYPITAKGVDHPLITPWGFVSDFVLFPFELFAGARAVAWVFMPPNAFFGGWHYALQGVALALGWVAAFAWLVPTVRPEGRILSLTFYLGLFYLNEVLRSVFAWYLPTVTVLGFLTLGVVFDQLLDLAKRLPQIGWDRGWLRHGERCLRVAAVVLVAGQAVVTVFTARQMAVQQELIETGLRTEIGLWLRDHARSPRDTVFLECLGYIGYYSQLKMLDVPGLSSPEVVEVRRHLGRTNQNQMYLELKPDWMVLRPNEAIEGNAMIDPRRINEFYDLVKVFDASKKVSAVRWLPGRPYLEVDQTFLIYRRKDALETKPAN